MPEQLLASRKLTLTFGKPLFARGELVLPSHQVGLPLGQSFTLLPEQLLAGREVAFAFAEPEAYRLEPGVVDSTVRRRWTALVLRLANLDAGLRILFDRIPLRAAARMVGHRFA